MEKKVSKKVIIIVVAAIILVAAGICVFLFTNKGITATTMRVLKLEGIVQLEENGVVKTVMENFRLKSGNALSTEQDSQVSIGLDESKIITLKELSRAEFMKKGKKLDLTLTKGSLFFNVKKKLAADESLNIHTSTMVVGIWGTSGLVFEEGNGKKFGIIVTDGSVKLKVTDPITGKVEEIVVERGQQLVVSQKDDGSVEYEKTDISAKDLPGFAAACVQSDPELLEKVAEDTGWDTVELIENGKSYESNGKHVEIISESEKDDSKDEGEPGSEELGTEEPGTEEPSTEVSEEASSTEESSASSEEDPNGEEDPGAGEDGEGDVGAAPPTLEEQKLMAQNAIVSIENGLIYLGNGIIFDPVFYAQDNPEVVAFYNTTDPLVMLAHWLQYGQIEGRPTIAPETVNYITNLHNPAPPQNPAGGSVGQGGGSSAGGSDSDTGEPEKKKKHKKKKHKNNSYSGRTPERDDPDNKGTDTGRTPERDDPDNKGTDTGGTGAHNDDSGDPNNNDLGGGGWPH